MDSKFSIRKGVLLALALPMAVALPQQTSAQEEEAIEEIVTTGTRRADRSASDSPVPIDVIGGQDFRQNSSSDVQDLLRTAVPSFDVNTQPISDAATIVRPANVRGLSPDNVLVLVNGKRRHRGSIISFLGGGISDGAQGVDISAIPSLALRQVEVLRDGASSQYGSDAIAGVINFVLREESEGIELQARYGSTFEGDGDNLTIAGNIGLPLGNSGFVNITGEFREVDGTVRSVVRDDVQAMIDGGYTPPSDFLTINSYTSEVPHYWGQPDVEDDFKLFVNSAVDLTDNAEAYFFANYGERTVAGGFFYRNPTGPGSSAQRPGVYRGPMVDPDTGLEDPADLDMDNVPSVLVGDLDGPGVNGCIDGIPINGVIPDQTFFDQVLASAPCFAFIETIPTGFVPRFGGDNEDRAFTVGVRGEMAIGNGLNYDFSAQQGSNRTDFFIRNTINASLGPNTPRDFVPGGQEQTETMFSANFVYGVDMGLASDLNVAFGAEYREEEFDLFAGDPASFALGPLADQGFSSSSNGFGGFPNTTSASQDSTAFYVDLEADVSDSVTLQGAVRYEDFSEFGDTTDFKIAGVWHVNDVFSVRGAVSTGFHAPTAGQANITNVTTQNVGGVLVDQGTLPLSSAAGQLAADFIESQGNGRPTLGPEDATNFSIGVAFEGFGGSSWTIDYYNIEVEDRVALGANVDFLAALNFADPTNTGYTTVSQALTDLDAQGVIDRQDYIGLDDLSEFRFFSNSFSTTTTGFDIVGNFGFDLGNGSSTVTVAANYNKTEVDDVGTVNPIGSGRVAALEDLLPNWKANVSWTHDMGDLRSLVRLNYYGEWDDTGNDVPGIGAEFLIDVELAYTLNENTDIVVGIENLFDTYPDENPGAGDLGQQYSEASPFGFNGAVWYLQGRFGF